MSHSIARVFGRSNTPISDADRARVVEGLAGASGVGGGHSAAELTAVIKGLEPRWFLIRNAHDREGVKLVMPRHAMSFMKGPIIARIF